MCEVSFIQPSQRVNNLKIKISFDSSLGIMDSWEDFETVKDAIRCARFIQQNYSGVIVGDGIQVTRNDIKHFKLIKHFEINPETGEEKVITDEAKKVVAELDAENESSNENELPTTENPSDEQTTKPESKKIRNNEEIKKDFIKKFSEEEWKKRRDILAEWQSLKIDEDLRERLKKSYPNITEYIDFLLDLEFFYPS